MQKVAAYPNVYCKLSGLATEADWQQHSYADFVPYLDAVTEMFGPQRLMFGSDWPVCLLADSYDANFAIIEQYFSSYSAEEKAAIFGENASRFYHL